MEGKAVRRLSNRQIARKGNVFAFQGAWGFSLIEILVSLAIASVVIALVMGTLPGVMQRASLGKCTANLRNIWVATQSYAAENDGKLPANQSGSAVFASVLRPYLGLENTFDAASMTSSPFYCPGDKYPANKPYWIGTAADPTKRWALSYGQKQVNADDPLRLSALPQASRMAITMDFESHYVVSNTTWGNNADNRQASLKSRHGGLMNVVFGDGHIEPLDLDKISFNPSEKKPPMLWTGIE